MEETSQGTDVLYADCWAVLVGRRTKKRGGQVDREGRLRWNVAVVAMLLGIGASSVRSIAASDVEPFLVRPRHVYEGLIKEIRDYLQTSNIMLFHGSLAGTREMDDLVGLQRYLSGILRVPTKITDFRTFQSQFQLENNYRSIERSLFVLLSDANEIREQLVLLSRWFGMAVPKWLIFSRNETAFEDLLSNVSVPFDCTMVIAEMDRTAGETVSREILTEVYRIGKVDALRSMKFGEWDASRGLQGPETALFQRRNNLYGQHIRLGSVENPPDSRIVRDKANRMIGVAGPHGELTEILREQLNCTYSYQESSMWGIRLPNGTWTGVVKLLMEGKVDIVPSACCITGERLSVIKFSINLYKNKCYVYFKRPDSSAVKWNTYLAPFGNDIWNSIAVTILVAGITIVGIDMLGRKLILFPSTIELSSPLELSEIIFLVFGSFCCQGMSCSSLDPIRLAELNIHTTGVVVLAAYSAALISYLTLKTVVLPFTSIEGMLEDGTYRFTVLNDSSDYDFFKVSRDPLMTKVFDEMLTGYKDLPTSDSKGLKSLCTKNKFAFMTREESVFLLRNEIDCTLEHIPSVVITNVRAFALPMDSPYRGIINRNVFLMRESGILKREYGTGHGYLNLRDSDWTSVDFNAVMPLFLFLILAYLIACLVLLVEMIVYRRCCDSRRHQGSTD